MDNASKAIIIAGGTLIAVIVISICMYMYTNFQVMYDDFMNVHEASQNAAFNSFFIEYGNEISGYEAYNIIGKINEVNNDPDSLIELSYEGIGRAIGPNGKLLINRDEFYFTENLKNLYSYSYTFDDEGLIEHIAIYKKVT